MNRLIRVILYITAGCVGVGAAALILAFALGPSEIKELAVLGTIKDRAEHVLDGFEQEDADDDAEHAYTQTFSPQDVKSLALTLRRGELEIKTGASDAVVVSVDGRKDDAAVSCEDGVLAIADVRGGKRVHRELDICLELPAGMEFSDVTVDAAAGVVDIEPLLTAKKMSLLAGAGEIDAGQLQAESFDAKVGVGSLEVLQGDFGTMSLDCGVGAMDIAASVTGDAALKCGLGAVTFDILGDEKDANYALSCGLGAIDIDGQIYSSLAKEKRIDNGSSRTFTLDCGLGSITVQR